MPTKTQTFTPTDRCEPWCRTHELDASETRTYAGRPHVWHRAKPIEIIHGNGHLRVHLELFEPANDPTSHEPVISVYEHDAPGDECPLHMEDIAVGDARAVAVAILELYNRAEGPR